MSGQAPVLTQEPQGPPLAPQQPPELQGPPAWPPDEPDWDSFGPRDEPDWDSFGPQPGEAPWKARQFWAKAMQQVPGAAERQAQRLQQALQDDTSAFIEQLKKNREAQQDGWLSFLGSMAGGAGQPFAVEMPTKQRALQQYAEDSLQWILRGDMGSWAGGQPMYDPARGRYAPDGSANPSSPEGVSPAVYELVLRRAAMQHLAAEDREREAQGVYNVTGTEAFGRSLGTLLGWAAYMVPVGRVGRVLGVESLTSVMSMYGRVPSLLATRVASGLGAMGVVYGHHWGAGPLPSQVEAIERSGMSPEEKQQALENIAHYNGLANAIALPVFHVAMGLGHKLMPVVGMPGFGLANATTRSIVQGAALHAGAAAADTATHQVMQQALPPQAIQQLIQVQLLAEPKLGESIGKFLGSLREGNLEQVQAQAKAFGDGLLPDAGAFGALNLLAMGRNQIGTMLAARDAKAREAFQQQLQELATRAEKELVALTSPESAAFWREQLRQVTEQIDGSAIEYWREQGWQAETAGGVPRGTVKPHEIRQGEEFASSRPEMESTPTRPERHGWEGDPHPERTQRMLEDAKGVEREAVMELPPADRVALAELETLKRERREAEDAYRALLPKDRNYATRQKYQEEQRARERRIRELEEMDLREPAAQPPEPSAAQERTPLQESQAPVSSERQKLIELAQSLELAPPKEGKRTPVVLQELHRQEVEAKRPERAQEPGKGPLDKFLAEETKAAEPQVQQGPRETPEAPYPERPEKGVDWASVPPAPREKSKAWQEHVAAKEKRLQESLGEEPLSEQEQKLVREVAEERLTEQVKEVVEQQRETTERQVTEGLRQKVSDLAKKIDRWKAGAEVEAAERQQPIRELRQELRRAREELEKREAAEESGEGTVAYAGLPIPAGLTRAGKTALLGGGSIARGMSRFWSSAMRNRVGQKGGLVGAVEERMARKHASRERELVGSVADQLKLYDRLTSKNAMRDQGRAGWAAVESLKQQYVTEDGRNTTKLIEATEGRIPWEDLSPAEKRIVNLLRWLTYESGTWAERAGMMMDTPTGPVPFQAKGARKRFLRRLTPEIWDVIQRGRGPDYDALVAQIAKENKLGKAPVIEKVKALAEPTAYAKDAVETQRMFEFMPAWIDVQGRRIPVLEASPSSAGEAVVRSAASRVAFAELYGQGSLEKRLQRYQDAGGERERLIDLYRSMHHLPIDRPVLEQMGMGTIERNSYTDKTLRTFEAAGRGWINSKLVWSWIPNLPEVYSGTGGLFGMWRVMNAQHRLYLRGEAAQFYHWAMRAGAIPVETMRFAVEPGREIEGRERNLSQVLLAPTRLVQQFISNLSAAKVGQMMVEQMKAQTGMKVLRAIDREALRVMGFAPREIELMQSGKAPQHLYDEFVRQMVPQTVFGGLLPSERSKAMNSRWFTSTFRIQSFATSKWNQLMRVLKNVVDAAREEGVTSKREMAAIALATRYMFGSAAAGSSSLMTRALVAYGIYGAGVYAVRSAQDFFRFASESLWYTLFGGAADALVEGLSGEEDQDWYDPLMRQVPAVAAINDIANLLAGRHRYKDQSMGERLETWFHANLPVMPRVNVWLGSLWGQESDAALQAAIRTYYQWRRSNAKLGKGTPAEDVTDEKIHERFRIHMRRVAKELQRSPLGFDRQLVRNEIIAAGRLKGAQATQSSLYTRRFTKGQDFTTLPLAKQRELIEHMGPELWRKLQTYDAVLDAFAAALD